MDLFHDLPDLLDKANKHNEAQSLEPDKLERHDRSNFQGMTQEQIYEEHQEYVIMMSVT